MKAASWIAIAVAAIAACDHKPRPKADETVPEPVPVPVPDQGSGTGTGSGPGSGTGTGTGTGSGEPEVLAALRAKNPELFDRCTAAAQHALGIALNDTPAAGREKALRDQPAQMQSMREQCVNQRWSSELLTCITTAKNVDALVECQRLLPGRAGGAP